MSDANPYDTGRQAERTLLAWRRTTLALAVGSAIGIRFTIAQLGWLAITLGAAGIVLSLTAYLATGIHYRQVHHRLHESDQYPGSGWPPTILTASVLALAAAALAYLIRHH